MYYVYMYVCTHTVLAKKNRHVDQWDKIKDPTWAHIISVTDI